MRSLRSALARALGAATIAGVAAFVPSAPAHAACSYTIDGYVKVKDFRVEGQHTTEPLEGVKVKVLGRDKILGVWGTFNSWGTATTDTNGHFRVVHSECNDRNVKVQASFAGNDLVVKGNGNKTWYDIFKDSVNRTPGTVPVGTMTFGSGAKNDLGNSAGRSNAETWVVYRKALDYLSSIGHPIGHMPFTVHNPFDTVFTNDTSYTDPVTDDVHIHVDDEFELETMLHELGHAVTYPLVSGEDCLLWELAADQSTHDHRESGCVSFHEGMAEFISEEIEKGLIDAGELTVAADNGLTPWTRAFLDQDSTMLLNSLDEMEHNEDGWLQLFKIGARDALQLDEFGTASDPSVQFVDQRSLCLGSTPPTIGLAKTLNVLDGFDTNPAIEIDFRAYLDAAEMELSTVDDSDVDDFLEVVDVTKTAEPCSLFSSITFQPLP